MRHDSPYCVRFFYLGLFLRFSSTILIGCCVAVYQPFGRNKSNLLSFSRVICHFYLLFLLELNISYHLTSFPKKTGIHEKTNLEQVVRKQHDQYVELVRRSIVPSFQSGKERNDLSRENSMVDFCTNLCTPRVDRSSQPTRLLLQHHLHQEQHRRVLLFRA